MTMGSDGATYRGKSRVERKARVVLADDDDEARELAAQALRREGFDVFEARDGEELLQRVTSLRQNGHSVSAVVSDIDMPSCDGLHATLRLRTGSRALPIVLVTGFTNPDIYRAALQAGASTVLSKPIQPNQLTRSVRQALLERRYPDAEPDAAE
jgi:CheY-like chemotaxis protein